MHFLTKVNSIINLVERIRSCDLSHFQLKSRLLSWTTFSISTSWYKLNILIIVWTFFWCRKLYTSFYMQQDLRRKFGINWSMAQSFFFLSLAGCWTWNRQEINRKCSTESLRGLGKKIELCNNSWFSVMFNNVCKMSIQKAP